MSLLGRFHDRHVHARRVRVLASAIARLLPADTRTVLDIGCGDGRLALLLHSLRPGISITGVDVQARPGAHIPVLAYDGATLPFSDRSFDAALLVDVLHHTDSPARTLREAARVVSRCVVLKDHLLSGFAARATLRFMDEIGNRRHGVALPHHYLDQPGWDAAYAHAGLVPVQTDRRPALYPWPASILFDRALHFVARLEPAAQPPPANVAPPR